MTDAPRGKTGFTLLELLVVLLIIGITISMIGLTGGQERQYLLRHEMERLAALVDLASDQAALNAVDHGLTIFDDGYQFHILNQEGTWTVLHDDETFRPRAFAEGLQAHLTVQGDPVALGLSPSSADKTNPVPQIIMGRDGAMTPFELEFRDQSSESNALMRADFNGGIQMENQASH